MRQAVKVQKVENNGVACLVFMLSSSVLVLKLSKNVLQLCAAVSKKSQSFTGICIYSSEISHFQHFQKTARFIII